MPFAVSLVTRLSAGGEDAASGGRLLHAKRTGARTRLLSSPIAIWLKHSRWRQLTAGSEFP